jgi:hypothetical protein
MEDSLTNAFRRYAELICATLRNHRAFDGRLRETGIVMLQPDKRFEFLPWMVEQMEEDEPFRHLVMATRATFPDQHYTQNDGLPATPSRISFAVPVSILTSSRVITPTSTGCLRSMPCPLEKRKGKSPI